MRIKYITFFCFVLFVSCGSAVTLSMSPPQIDFVGEKGEVICQNVMVEVEGVETLTGKTRWAEEGFNERKLLEHRLVGEDLRLDIDILSTIEIDGSKEVEVCIEGKSSGTYHGLLLYKIENKPVQVGIWMNVSLGGQKSSQKITGNAVGVSSNSGNKWFVLPLVLITIFGGLVWIAKRKE